MNEIWKDIKGFEGLYQISNCGRVKTLSRKVDRFSTRWGTDASYVIPEKIREGSCTRGGYLFIPLTKDKTIYPKRINRLVAEAFIDNYSEGKDVHHIDGDITNNHVDNLECLSDTEHHKRHKGKSVVGTNGQTTIFLEQICDAKDYGFDPANVSRCCKCALLSDDNPKRKKYATHKGYKWQYAE